jgi:hypothetical protein
MRAILVAAALLLLATSTPVAQATEADCVFPDSYTLPAGPKGTSMGPGWFTAGPAADGGEPVPNADGGFSGTTVVITCVQSVELPPTEDLPLTTDPIAAVPDSCKFCL